MSTNVKPQQSKRARLAADFMAAFNAHDPKKAMSLMNDNPVWEFAVGPSHFGVSHEGREAVRKAMETTFSTNPDISYEDLRIYDSGDSIIYEVLTQAPSRNLKVQSVDILSFDNNDKIAFKRTYRKVVTPVK